MSQSGGGKAAATLLKLVLVVVLLLIVGVALIDRQAAIEQVGTYEAVERLVNSGDSVDLQRVHDEINKEPELVERQPSRHVMWEHYRWQGVLGRSFTVSVRYKTGSTELIEEVQQNTWKGQPFLESETE